MGSITIRRLDEVAKRNARQVAAGKGRSLEAELRELIERTYGEGTDFDRAARIRAMSNADFVAHLVKTANGATLELPERTIDEDRTVFGAD
ncbi:FitA-like ribbon-helix-helix domain-containing protein [Sphingomonas profundi]|uniref:FitA-like ribbon-helix-helix domain-containing protein n=1 Tax=Alterirhizorhabdus profundi TaxID=2681549 RepID=UPI0012E7586D|nr:plasmid stabilization protein [Sphingomonas profundi]